MDSCYGKEEYPAKDFEENSPPTFLQQNGTIWKLDPNTIYLRSTVLITPRGDYI